MMHAYHHITAHSAAENIYTGAYRRRFMLLSCSMAPADWWHHAQNQQVDTRILAQRSAFQQARASGGQVSRRGAQEMSLLDHLLQAELEEGERGLSSAELRDEVRRCGVTPRASCAVGPVASGARLVSSRDDDGGDDDDDDDDDGGGGGGGGGGRGGGGGGGDMVTMMVMMMAHPRTAMSFSGYDVHTAPAPRMTWRPPSTCLARLAG
eukprot:COSAG01_NODE_1072_length_11863_cov_13.614587_2_plen_208_part_00